MCERRVHGAFGQSSCVRDRAHTGADAAPFVSVPGRTGEGKPQTRQACGRARPNRPLARRERNRRRERFLENEAQERIKEQVRKMK